MVVIFSGFPITSVSKIESKVQIESKGNPDLDSLLKSFYIFSNNPNALALFPLHLTLQQFSYSL